MEPSEATSSADATSVKDDEIYAVVKELGPDGLQHLFHNLGIAQHNIANEEKNANSNDPRIRAMQVLDFWKQSRGNDATRQVLHKAKQNALRQVKHQDEDDADNWRYKLREKYKQSPTIRFGRNRTAEAETDDIFVELTLLEDREKDIGRPLCSYYELFYNLDHGVGRTPANGILLQGPAGIGKTTLLSRFAYLWAIENDSNDDSIHTNEEMRWNVFKLVLLVKLKYLTHGERLETTIVNQLLPDVSEKQIASVLSKLGPECLILLDGYDEIPKGVTARVLKSPLLCKCRFIVTTRPHLVDQFYQDDDKPRFADVKISGFSSENSRKYIQKFFKCNKQPSIGEDLINKIDQIPYFERFSSHPIILVMLCILWHNPDNREYKVYSWTVLFENAIKYLNKPFHTQSEMSSDILESVLVELGKPALEAIFNDTVQIRSTIFDKETLQKSFLIGLLVEEEGFHASDALVTFIHKTFQEFCAAKYLAHLAKYDSKQFQNVLLQKINLTNLSDMEYVLLFCCGLSVDAAIAIIPHTVGLVRGLVRGYNPGSFSTEKCKVLTIVFLMLYEFEICNADCSNEIKQSLHNEIVPLIKHGEHEKNVRFKLGSTKHFPDPYFRDSYSERSLLHFRDYYIEGSLELSNIINIALSYLALSCDNNSHVWLNHIEMLTVECKVSTDILMRLLARMPSVKLVKISYGELEGEIDENTPVPCTSIKVFAMKNESLSAPSISANSMMRLLKCMPSVETVELRGMRLVGETDKEISVSCTSLTEFSMSAESISTNHVSMSAESISANSMMRMLKCMPSVETVELRGMRLVGEIDKEISVSCTSLTEFTMTNVSVSYTTMMRLLERMPRVKSIAFDVNRFEGEIQENTSTSCSALFEFTRRAEYVSPNSMMRLFKCMQSVDPMVESATFHGMTFVGDIDKEISVSCTSLIEFSMSAPSVSANSLMRLLKCMPSVESVKLREMRLEGEIDEEISVSCTSLTEFTMDHVSMESNTMMKLLKFMPRVKSIAFDVNIFEVEIQENRSTSCSALELTRRAEYVSPNSFYWMTLAGDIEKKMSVLPCTSLIEFSMSAPSVSANSLMRLLKCIPSVESVKLREMRLEGEIDEEISVNCTSLTEFTMTNVSVSYTTMMRLLESMPRVKSIAFDVNIFEGEIQENTSTSCSALFEFTRRAYEYVSPNLMMRLLKCMQSVESVTLHRMTLADEKISVSCTSLTKFTMAGVSVRSNTMIKLLKCMPRLKSIKFYVGRFEGEIHENTSVCCTSLTEFTIDNVSVSANTIMRLLKCMPSLTSATLRWMTYAGKIDKETTVDCTSRTQFTMDNVSATTNKLMRLLESMPRVKSIIFD